MGHPSHTYYDTKTRFSAQGKKNRHCTLRSGRDREGRDNETQKVHIEEVSEWAMATVLSQRHGEQEQSALGRQQQPVGEQTTQESPQHEEERQRRKHGDRGE